MTNTSQPVDDGIASVAVQLHDAHSILGHCHQSLGEVHGALMAERAHHRDTMRAYQELGVQYRQVATDYNEMVSKTRSLYKELEEAYTTILANETVTTSQPQPAEATQPQAESIGRTERRQLEAKIEALQKEKAEMQSALNAASDMIDPKRKREAGLSDGGEANGCGTRSKIRQAGRPEAVDE